MDKETVLFCVKKVSRLAGYAGDLAIKATSPKEKLNALARRDILLEVELVLLKSMSGIDYCGECGEWRGGPTICCEKSQQDGGVKGIPEIEAFAVRAARMPG